MSIRRAQDERIEGTPDGVNAITEIADVPDAPTIGTATAAGLSASITFTPATTGGTGATFTAISTPGLITGTASSSPITVSGLAGDTSYTFTVRASNSTGDGPISASSNSITAVSPIDSGYDSLAAITLSSTVSSITFSGIPTGYRHLQVRCISKADAAGNGYSLVVTANGDETVGNYRSHYLEGNGSSATGGTYQSVGGAYFVGGSTGAGTDGNWFGTTIFDLLDYSATTKNKTFRGLTGHDRNGNGNIHLSSAVWLNTSAVTNLKISLAGANMVAKTQFALYGVK